MGMASWYLGSSSSRLDLLMDWARVILENSKSRFPAEDLTWGVGGVSLKYWKRLGDTGEEDLGWGWNSGNPLETEEDQMLGCLQDKASEPRLYSEARNFLLPEYG